MVQLRYQVLVVLVSVLLVSCGSTMAPKSRGGFYGGDSAPKGTRDFNSIPDAVPRAEPRSRTGNNPYTALGKRYVPLKDSTGFTQTGMASWYGTKFHGRRTSSGEPYDMWAMTAAHPVLPLPTYVRVTNLDNGKSIVVKVNDRGPFLHGRVIDLSYAAAHKLDIANKGTGRVKIVALDPVGNKPESGLDETVFVPREGSIGEGTSGVFLQTGAYSDIGNARTERVTLELLGLPVFPASEQALIEEGIPYRVQAGPFSDYSDAAVARDALEKRLGRQVLLIVK